GGELVGGVPVVVVQARSQGLGLAHVDGPPVPVLELVGAGGFGNGAGRRALDHVTNLPVGRAFRYASSRRRPGIRRHIQLRGRQPRGWATRLSPPAVIGADPHWGLQPNAPASRTAW